MANDSAEAYIQMLTTILNNKIFIQPSYSIHIGCAWPICTQRSMNCIDI